MKRSRIISLMLCLALFAAVLAGCSKTSGKGFDFSSLLNKNGTFKDVDMAAVVTLPDYKNFEYAAETLEVSDEDLMTEISALLAEFQTATEVKDRPVEDGDTLNIDYVGSVDGVEFEGGSTEGNGTEVTIGVTNYIDDFLQQLIGHKPGENFDIEVTFPDEYQNEELEGKDAVFNITINSIIEYVDPELTDAFVKENFEGVYESVDDMYTKVTDSILNTQKLNDVWEQLTTGAECSEIPENVFEFEKQVMLNYYKTMAAQYGMEFEDYLATINIADEDAFVTEYTEEINGNAMNTLVVQAFMAAEGLEVTDADLDEYFAGDYTALEDVYGKPYLKLAIMQDVAVKSIMDYME